jgi:hypothetical protein
MDDKLVNNIDSRSTVFTFPQLKIKIMYEIIPAHPVVSGSVAALPYGELLSWYKGASISKSYPIHNAQEIRL